jgi:hypothetical protein
LQGFLFMINYCKFFLLFVTISIFGANDQYTVTFADGTQKAFPKKVLTQFDTAKTLLNPLFEKQQSHTLDLPLIDKSIFEQIVVIMDRVREHVDREMPQPMGRKLYKIFLAIHYIKNQNLDPEKFFETCDFLGASFITRAFANSWYDTVDSINALPQTIQTHPELYLVGPSDVPCLVTPGTNNISMNNQGLRILNRLEIAFFEQNIAATNTDGIEEFAASNNLIKEPCLAAINEIFPKLKKINLANNKIVKIRDSIGDAETDLKTIARSGHIEEIDLTGNPLDAETKKLLTAINQGFSWVKKKNTLRRWSSSIYFIEAVALGATYGLYNLIDNRAVDLHQNVLKKIAGKVDDLANRYPWLTTQIDHYTSDLAGLTDQQLEEKLSQKRFYYPFFLTLVGIPTLIAGILAVTLGTSIATRGVHHLREKLGAADYQLTILFDK